MPIRTATKLEDCYEVDDSVLGSGAFGEVRICVSKGTKEQRVAKKMVKSEIADQVALMDELSIQADLDHPHICRVFDFFSTQEHLALVLEACHGGDLSDAICEADSFTEADAKHFMGQVLMAVNYMHGKNICHRDLKPENFLLQEQGVPHIQNVLKVIDFGFARDFVPGEMSLTTKCGTPSYIAPEIVAEDRYNEKCDIWSCGIILYSFLCGDVPFEGNSVNEIMANARRPLSFDDEIWQAVSPTARLVIVQMLKREPDKRFSVEQTMKSPWFAVADFEAQDQGALMDTHTVVARMRRFRTWGKFQRACAQLILHVLPDKQMHEYRNTFQAMDKNKDGKLSLKELKDGLSDRNPQDIEQLFREADTEQVGFVSWSEFLSAVASREVLTQESACRAAFEVLDVDRDGSVCIDELRQLFVQRSDSEDCSSELAEFQRFDKNGDGKVCFDEFRQIMLEVLACCPSPVKRRRTTCTVDEPRLAEKKNAAALKVGCAAQGQLCGLTLSP